jgi:hypothetical protein
VQLPSDWTAAPLTALLAWYTVYERDVRLGQLRAKAAGAGVAGANSNQEVASRLRANDTMAQIKSSRAYAPISPSVFRPPSWSEVSLTIDMEERYSLESTGVDVPVTKQLSFGIKNEEIGHGYAFASYNCSDALASLLCYCTRLPFTQRHTFNNVTTRTTNTNSESNQTFAKRMVANDTMKQFKKPNTDAPSSMFAPPSRLGSVIGEGDGDDDDEEEDDVAASVGASKETLRKHLNSSENKTFTAGVTANDTMKQFAKPQKVTSNMFDAPDRLGSVIGEEEEEEEE